MYYNSRTNHNGAILKNYMTDLDNRRIYEEVCDGNIKDDYNNIVNKDNYLEVIHLSHKITTQL